MERSADARPARARRARYRSTRSSATRTKRTRRGRRPAAGRRALHAPTSSTSARRSARTTTRRRSASAARPRSSAACCHRAYDSVRVARRGARRAAYPTRTTATSRARPTWRSRGLRGLRAEDAYAYRFVGERVHADARAPNSCDVDAEAAVRGARRPAPPVPDARAARRRSASAAWRSRSAIPRPASSSSATPRSRPRASRASARSASQLFPVLRGEVPEDAYFTGENLRGYYARLGLVEHPVSIAPSGIGRHTRSTTASRPPSSQARPRSSRTSHARMQALAPKIEQAARPGRARGDPPGPRAAAARQRARRRASTRRSQRDAGAAPIRARACSSTPSRLSLVDESPLDQALRERQRRQSWPRATWMTSRPSSTTRSTGSYWAERVRRPLAATKPSLRMQQLYFAQRHGARDRPRARAAPQLRRQPRPQQLPRRVLPDRARARRCPCTSSTTTRAMGGNDDGDVTGAEAERWATDLRAAREERLALGAGNVMTSSVDGLRRRPVGLRRHGPLRRRGGDVQLLRHGRGLRVAAIPTAYPGADAGDVGGALSLEGLAHADSYRRELWTLLPRRRDLPAATRDCPHRAGRETTAFQPITQRCVSNPRVPNTTGELRATAAASARTSSTTSRTTGRRARTAEHARARVRAGRVPVLPRQPRERPVVVHAVRCRRVVPGGRRPLPALVAAALPAGLLPQLPPRRARRAASRSRRVVDAVKIYQHLFFRYNYEGAEFRNSTGPLGYADQLFASADVLNWLGGDHRLARRRLVRARRGEQHVSSGEHASRTRPAPT